MEDYKVRQTGPEVQEALDQTPINQQAIEAIQKVLPEGATEENPLTDKEYVDGKVSEEATAREQAVTAEETRAEGVEQTLQQGINTEAQTRQQADGVLDGKIGANTQAIAAENTRAEGAEMTLDGKIGDNTQAIANEKTRAEGAEAALQQLIQQVSASLVNYYLKTETYSKAEVNTIIDNVKQFRYQVAATLPTASADTMGIIYLIPSANPKTQNIKEEYLTILDGSTYKWEHIGNTNIDLSGYSTTEQMNAAIATALANYYTKAQVDGMVTTINAAIEQKAGTEELENGNIVPAKAGNLESWAEESVPVDNEFSDTIRTTAGVDTIDSAKGGTLLSIIPTTDFSCEGLVSTAENQLRLLSNGGGAVAVGDGWYFPVPELTLGQFGTMNENNGLILVASDGRNIANATVRFKALADGVPTSVTDGVVATSQNVTYNGKTYKVYTTNGPGYIIISGITYAETCARIAWEDWYDKFVSPTDPDDVGGSVNLIPLFSAAPNGSGKFLVLGTAKTTAERTSDTVWRITDPIGVVAEPVWTNTEVVDPETEEVSYLHSTVIAALGSQAVIEGADINLTCDGTTASYSDSNAEAATGAVRYEKAVPAYVNVNLASAYRVNDVGVEMKTGATGDATFVCEYAQNIADAVANATPTLATLRTSAAAVSLGRALCSTNAYEAMKMVTIPNFTLLANGIITVLFTAPVLAENATLSVNLLGAKPIKILGQALPAGLIKAESEVQMEFDGTVWNVINIFQPQGIMPTGILVDMGLPSGVKWASRDIDLTKTGGFCETPFTYMKSFFSWGNIDGHNPSSVSAFDYNWGGVNQAEPWYDGQVYGSTPGNTLTGNIAVGEDFDAARANLGTPWRMPTSAEYAELFANIKYINADGTEVDTTKTDKRVTVNGVMGLYIESRINGARLFFSCSGIGVGRSWSYRGARGFYWSSTWRSARYARRLNFYDGGVNPQNDNYRYYGFALRPVQ